MPFIADLVEIHFRKDLADDQARLAWLDDHLWLQRKTIKSSSRSAEFPTWESQYSAWEIDNFLKASTCVRCPQRSENRAHPFAAPAQVEGKSTVVAGFHSELFPLPLSRGRHPDDPDIWIGGMTSRWSRRRGTDACAPQLTATVGRTRA